MNASADIQTKTKANVLSVAINAVTTREKGTDKLVGADKEKKVEEGIQETSKTTLAADMDEVVFVLQADGSVKKVKVKTDIQDINNIEITEGLKDGDEVVSAPYNVVNKILKDGMKVKKVEKDKLFEAKKS
jgi:HlyD family secretion protein